MRLLAALLAAALWAQAPSDGGALAGRCLTAQTGEALRGVSVQIVGLIHGQLFRQSTQTDAEGAFRLERLPPADYSFNIHKSGYRPVDGTLVRLSLEKNQTRAGLEFKMHRPAVVTGSARDPDGQPIVGADVIAHRFAWHEGRRTLVHAGWSTTDDRGVYRLHGLPAGRYLLGAFAPSEERAAGELDLALARTYYPSGGRASDAAPLDLRWGQEMAEINLVFHPQATYSISGLVADSEIGGPCRSCMIRASNLDEMYGQPVGRVSVAPDGGYRLRGLLPGRYRLSAEKPSAGRHLVSSRIVHVTGENVRDAHLVVGAGQSVAGRVAFESQPPKQNRLSLQVEFRPLEAAGERTTAAVRPELTFEVSGLSADTYRFRLSGLPPGGYLKALRLAGRDLPGPLVEVAAETSLADLEAVVAFDSASLTVAVQPPESAGRGHLVTAANIALFPEQNESPFLVERRGTTDSKGQLTLSGIAPGAYAVFALPAADAHDWEDPEIRRRFPGYGKTVDLRPGQKETIELRLAPESPS